jgi:hypothetical protein
MDKTTQRDLSIGIAIIWGAVLIASAVIKTWGEMWLYLVGGAAGSLIPINGIAIRKRERPSKG